MKNHVFLCGREEKYACPYCNKKFIIPHRVRKHIKAIHSDERIANCHLCDLTFTNLETYDKHMLLHSNSDTSNKELNCKKCNIAFGTEDEFKDHLKLHLETVQAKKKVDPRSEFLVHAKSRVVIHTCHICFKVFGKGKSSGSNLKRHLLKAHSTTTEKPTCNVCHKVFCKKYNLQRHLLENHAANPGEPDFAVEPRFKCDQCDKGFNTKNARKAHLNIAHGKGKPYSCDFCGQKFSYESSCILHQKKGKCRDSKNSYIQTKSIDVVCMVCQERFEDKQCMRKHVYDTHKEIKMFKCKTCDMIFPRSYYLSHHMKTVHYDYRDLFSLRKKDENK